MILYILIHEHCEFTRHCVGRQMLNECVIVLLLLNTLLIDLLSSILFYGLYCPLFYGQYSPL